jgi:membrane protein YdbS with pleckstrin-like domain
MEELVIRPTTKFIKAAYVVVALLILGAVIAQNQLKDSIPQDLPGWVIPGLLALLLLWPVSRHFRRQFTKMTMVGDKLRYETGMLSKATRTIQLSKVQDVTVRQSLTQRMAGIGDLSIETAGESSRLTFPNIDRPQAIADNIIDASHRIGVRGILDERDETQGKSGPGNGGEQGSGQGHGSGLGGGGR